MAISYSPCGREGREIGNRALHEARDAGESLSRLRDAYWLEANGGEKKGWRDYAVKELVEVHKVSYDILCSYIRVYVNWDIIVKFGWDKLTYEQVVTILLPLYWKTKPIPRDRD